MNMQRGLVKPPRPPAAPGGGASSSPAGDGESIRWLLAPVVALAAFMEVLDISIANVSLPHIAGDLGASQDESTWILTSYLVTNAIVLPISGWLSSVLGRKRFYMLCITGFAISSMFCGMAPNLDLLILFRAIQGVTGGGLQPVSQAILADSFPPRQRGMAFAFYGIAVVFAPAIGPTLGGFITDKFSWRWVFLINVPVGVTLLFLVQAMVHDPAHVLAERLRRLTEGFRMDYLGFGFLALGLGLLQVVLDKGEQDDWFSSRLILSCSIVAALALVAFILWELERDDPIVDLRLLRNGNFAVANILMLMLGFVLLGSTVLLPLFVQTLLGYTATEAGMVISPGGFVIMAMMPLVGRMVTRVDTRAMIAFGLITCSFALYKMTVFDLQVDFWTIAITRMIQGVGLAFLFIPINSSYSTGLPPEKSGNASAIINLSRNLGGSIGISILTTILSQRTQYHQALMVKHVNPTNPQYLSQLASLTQAMHTQGGTLAAATLRAQGMISQMLDQQATLLAYLDDFWFLAVLFVAFVPLVLLMKRTKFDGGPISAH